MVCRKARQQRSNLETQSINQQIVKQPSGDKLASCGLSACFAAFVMQKCVEWCWSYLKTQLEVCRDEEPPRKKGKKRRSVNDLRRMRKVERAEALLKEKIGDFCDILP